MNYDAVINNVKTKEDFIKFIHELREDKEKKDVEWENKDISTYLEGVCSWVEDMEGFFDNMNLEIPKDINWSFIATLFYVGKIYE